MSTAIELPDLQRLIEQGAQVVEVMPGEEFTEFHLPGAINIPLKQLDADSVSVLDPGRAIVVYCYDYL
jgi:rhodanese-related sulfurtransferase